MIIVVNSRVRPFNQREKQRESVCCIDMPGNNQTKIFMTQEKKKHLHSIIVFGIMMVLEH